MIRELEEDRVYFEAVVPSESGRSLFDRSGPPIAESLRELAPAAGRPVQAARALQEIGFRVRHIGTFSISGDVPVERWREVFSTDVERRRSSLGGERHEIGEVPYYSHVANVPFRVPQRLEGLVERAYPQPPPLFFELPLPPRVPYHHLRVPADVATLLRATAVQKRGVTGKGVLVAMPDTGFFKHRFYAWNGYNYNATLAPDAVFVERDEVGHGTAEAANIFAAAPDIDFVGVKMGGNATLAFKTASDLAPAVMTNSWGYDIPGPLLPNFLKPLEAAVVEAVRQRGIVVCFSAGNGHFGFPGQMPEVISVGGVYARDVVNGAGDDLELEASDYASSFMSTIYPGRRVPDVCGLVGMQPRAIYILLPVEPGDLIDQNLGGPGFPNSDETALNDGWAVISGTSAASPQVAGVCALLKQTQPGLSPDLVKAILRASARDVRIGKSAHGEQAGVGHDGATGAGLVDAEAAHRLGRSIATRPLNALPAPV